MALAPFFERVYGAVGGHLRVSREALTTALGNVTAGVRCAERLDANQRAIAELTTNILARLYPRIAMTGSPPFVNELGKLARNINPKIDITTEAADTTTVCVGGVSADGALFPSASGWVARLDHHAARESGPENIYAAGAAATLACAELFRRVFVGGSTESDCSISLLNFDTSSGAEKSLQDTDIGDVLFAGVGAVGNAALWALFRDRTLHGKLILLDAENLALSNLQRYVLAMHSHVGLPKVEYVKVLLGHSGLKAEARQLSLEDFAGTPAFDQIATIAISVDNVAGRRAAQALLPKLVVNGWTGDQALGASWHVLSRNAACLACLYHPHGQGVSAIEQASKALGLPPDRTALLWVTRQPLSSTDLTMIAHALGVKESVLKPWRNKPLGEIYTEVVCGSVPLDVKGVAKVEAVPLAHQSVLAGILMAAELVKRTSQPLSELSQSEPLVSWDNVLQPPPQMWTKPRAREIGCICGDADYQAIFRSKWGGHLSTLPS